MKKIILNVVLGLLILGININAQADIIPKDAKAGDRYIKITKVIKNEKFCNMAKKKYTLIKFEVCTIDKVEMDASNHRVITDKECSLVNSGSERHYFTEHRLRQLREKLNQGANISVFMGLFLVGTTFGDAADRHAQFRLLRNQIIRDEDVTFHDQSNLSYEEEEQLERNNRNEVSYFPYMLEKLQHALQSYDKEYKKICFIEKDPQPQVQQPVAPPPAAHDHVDMSADSGVRCGQNGSLFPLQ